MSKKRKGSLKKALRAFELTPEQRKAVEDIYDYKIIVITGVAGTSKTFVSVYAALQMLDEKRIEDITLSRPLVATEKFGFLPGDLNEKIEPYLAPLISFLNQFGPEGEGTFDTLVHANKVVSLPLALMRGHTISDGVLLLDEAQNTTPEQMLMALTRLGKNGKIIVNGDPRQNDTGLKVTGLDMLLRISEVLPYIKHIHLTQNMRDEMVSEIIETWDRLAPKAN